MKVHEIGYEVDRFVGETTGNRKTKAAQVEESKTGIASESQNRDAVVEISRASQEVQLAKDVIAAEDEIRREKVEAIKNQIDSNRYMVDTDKAAEKIDESLYEFCPRHRQKFSALSWLKLVYPEAENKRIQK